MRGFGERLRQRGKQMGLSDAEVARRAGLEPRRYGNYVTNDREPDLTTLLTISQVLETTPDWLLGVAGNEELPRYLGSRKEADIVTYAGEEYAAIKSYDVRAAAGAGAENQELEPSTRLLFRMQWLRSVTNAAPDNLAVIEIDGDSMEPTLRPGDTALVDLSQRNPRNKDGLYAIRSDGGLQVKRVSVNPQTKKLTIQSDNPTYRDFDDIDPTAIVVLARVIWIGRRV